MRQIEPKRINISRGLNQGLMLLIYIMFAMPSTICMATTMKENMPAHIKKEIAAGNYAFTGTNFKFSRGNLQGWLLEEDVFTESTYKGAEIYYKEKYKGKKENFADITTKDGYIEEKDQLISKLDKYDMSTYWMVYSFASWLDFVRGIYDIPQLTVKWEGKYSPQPNNMLSFVDAHCYRILNPERNRMYDVFFMVSKRDDFNFKKQPDLQTRELKFLKAYHEKSVHEASLETYRFADYIEPRMEYAAHVDDFFLMQLVVKRIVGGPGFWAILRGKVGLWSYLHDDRERRRVRDTYIFILTGEKVKLIIQTFYDPSSKFEDITNEMKNILSAITINN